MSPSWQGLQDTLIEPLQTGNTLPNECHGYNTKGSDGEAQVMPKLWGMQINPSLPLLPGPLWPRVIAPDRVLSMEEIELKRLLVLN